jgi:hypothetical protein
LTTAGFCPCCRSRAEEINAFSAHADYAEAANLPRAVQDLKDAGFWIYGADMAGEAVYGRDLRGRVALILGGEGSGISRLLREACDGLVSIPGTLLSFYGFSKGKNRGVFLTREIRADMMKNNLGGGKQC